ncbi:MAG: hypothetical protein HPY55_03525 [Firmicutes bacterium]|nr:hypothetical protein [Bacillota bacterium]
MSLDSTPLRAADLVASAWNAAAGRPGTTGTGGASKPSPKEIERRRLKEVCQEFEAFLVREVLKGLKSTAGLKTGVSGNGPAGADIQMGIADDQFSGWISQSGGLGLGKMLYESLVKQMHLDDAREGNPTRSESR